MARILFLYPALLSGWASYKEHGNNETSYADLGFSMISAVLKRAGHECFSMDLRSFQSWEHFETILKQQTFDLTLVSFFSVNEKYAKQAIEIVKRNFPNKYIIAGGIHLSVTQTRSYPNVDTIVLGEGEPHILEIVETIQLGGTPKPVYELKMVENLDLLPFVDRNLFNPRMEETSPLLAGLPEPFITIVAGRGCPHVCSFCSESKKLISGKKCRVRSVDNFLEEILTIHAQKKIEYGNGIGSLMIHDDLLGTKTWMSEFIEKWHSNNLPRIPIWCQLRADTVIKMKELIPELAEIGLQYVSIGLESGSARMLEFLNKKTTVEQNIEACKILHDNGINLFANYIICLPTETKEDLDGTEKMLSEIRPTFHSRSVYTSYAGSVLYDWIVANNYWAEPESHYSMTRYPYERKIKGIDYEATFNRCNAWSALTSPLRIYQKTTNKVYFKSLDHIKSQTIQINRPKASVILVTYNRPIMLKEAIQSIFNQTMTDWELLVMDYTTDWNINKSVYDWAVLDKRVRYIRHTEDINNIAYIWNEGLDLIRGKYWCTLDDDNIKYPQYLEKMIDYLEKNPENDAVVCAMEHTGQTSGIHFVKPLNFFDEYTGNKIDSGQVVYRKSVIEKVGVFDERLVSMEDWDYILRVYSLNNQSGSSFGWLPDDTPLCNYNWHVNKRMYDEGIKKTYDTTEPIIKNKKIKNNLRIKYIEPGGIGRTESQIQLSDNILEALKSFCFIELVDDNPDMVIISGTLYNMHPDTMKALRQQNNQATFVALLCEDPQVLHENIKYTEYIDWMVTNDINAYDYYIQNIVDLNKKKQVLHWNNLSISNKLLQFIESYNPDKEYDVCMVGHGYPSRVELIRELMPLIPDKKVVLIGNLWKNHASEFHSNEKVLIYDTVGEIEAAKIAIKSRIILVKHRDDKDLHGFPIVKPNSVNRGYIEAAYRSVLMIDNARQYYTFEPDTIFRYNNAKDCAEQIKSILSNYNYKDKIDMLFNKAIENFTHRERLLKVLNCVRSPRYNKKIE